jgi:ABC-type transport system involved in multi-copper enzyme maturation permease subunit
MRLGLGPVFAFEWLTTARRWQLYAGRALFVSGLLAALTAVWYSEVQGKPLATLRAQAAVGQSFFYAIVGTQLALVLLAAPAATAGSICLDKARGTLTHLLVTDLSDSEIVLGKLAVRLIPVAGFVGCVLPVMALGTLLGGIDPVALAGAIVVAIGTGLLACTLALAFSVWGTKTHEVLMVTYGLLVLWVLGGPSLSMVNWVYGSGWSLPDWFTASNPFWLAFAPYSKPGSVGPIDYAVFIAATVALSIVLTTVAVLRLRAVAARQAGRGTSQAKVRLARPFTWRLPLPGPSLDFNPVLWREWHRNRPSKWLRIVWAVYWAAVIGCCLITLQAVLDSNQMRMEISSILVGGQVAFGLLLLSISAPTALTEEKVRGSLDVLMATPLSTPTIVWGKWWGTYRTVFWIAVCPTITTAAMVLRSGTLLAFPLTVALIFSYGASFTSLGLALATWCKRPGRAIAGTVAAYVLVTVGWFMLVVMLTMNTGGVTGPGLASGSPFIGTIFPLVQMHRPNGTEWAECIVWLLFWMSVHLGSALVLFIATLRTFNAHLGRVSTIYDRWPRPAPRIPPQRSLVLEA